MEPGTVSQPAESRGAPAGGATTGIASESEGYDAAIAKVVESAQRLGIDIDRREAEEWVSAMENEEAGGDLVVDVNTGVYGYRVTMLDFAPADLARFRDMGKIVGFEDRPPNVLTALSISGSAAQSKINAFPADCDFFQRINIKADTREEACAILADMIREKALATASGPNHRLWEVKFGQHPVEATKGGKPVGVKSPMSWTPDEVRAGHMEVELMDGSKAVYTWADATRDPGWCKLDWVIADSSRGKLANASNVLDTTWEGPDGKIVPLDGFLDPYFQEVYLDADSIPIFSKLVKELSADTVDEYVETLEHEVWKYTVAGTELRQSRSAAVQRLPNERPVRRGGLHPRALRRADHGALPGRGPDPDTQRRGRVRRRLRLRDDDRASGHADHVGHPGTRRA